MPKKSSSKNSARLWPTPQAHDAQGPKTQAQIQAMRERSGAGVSNLNEAVKLWPTPNTQDHRPPRTAETMAKVKQGGGGKNYLREEVKLWPTPTANMDAGGNNRTQRPESEAGRKAGRQLQMEVRDSTPTSSPSTDISTPESILLQEDFLASHSARPGSDAARMMTVISGRRCFALLAKQVPGTSLLKMLLACSHWSSQVVYLRWKLKRLSFFSRLTTTQSTRLFKESTDELSPASFKTLKKSDMTFPDLPMARQSFCVCQLAPSMPDTDEIEYGLLPTPRTVTGGAESAERKQELGRTNSGGGDLQAAVKLWPTPTKQDGENNAGPSQFQRNTPPLNAAVKMFPTVTTGDAKGQPETASLNPQFVEWLMGYPKDWTTIGDTPKKIPKRRASSTASKTDPTD